MRPLLVLSRQDPVGLLLLGLLERHSFRPLGEGLYEDGMGVRLLALSGSPLYLEALEEGQLGDATDIIFLHKHSSESGLPVFTVHQPGNFTAEARLGGRPREVALVNPTLFAMLLRALHRLSQRERGLPVVLEATHHGPTSLPRPALFVELGSTPKQWGDVRLAELLLRSVLSACHGQEPVPEGPVALMTGGPHYSEKFTRLVLEGGLRPAGIASKHALALMDRAMLLHALSRSVEPVTHLLVDWKGVRAAQRALLFSLAEERGLTLVRA